VLEDTQTEESMMDVKSDGAVNVKCKEKQSSFTVQYRQYTVYTVQ
jgi:hypothetical protein